MLHLAEIALAGQRPELVGNEVPLAGIETAGNALQKDEIEEPLLPTANQYLGAHIRQ